ncbi:hypothetical protein [Alloalcanivorax mobilis]|uniref:hypothetical protein n=1 Tax=Alloalcanivorax mobilis TaxID=2019569 RepID=UPI001E5076AE|nr:hypothetical protein [Alloalcanivorax mobilis]
MTQHHARQAAATLQRGVTRRRFLKWTLIGAAGAAAVAAGGFALLRRSPLDRRPPPAWADGLSRQEFHLFDRARVALLPTAGSVLTPADRVPVVANVQRTLGFVDAATRKDLAMAFTLFDNAAVFSHGKRFVDLDEQQARLWFDQWGAGNTLQRTLATVIKQLTYSAYWRHPSTWAAVEFDGPVSERWGLAYLGNAPLPVEPPAAEPPDAVRPQAGRGASV